MKQSLGETPGHNHCDKYLVKPPAHPHLMFLVNTRGPLWSTATSQRGGHLHLGGGQQSVPHPTRQNHS